MGGMWSTKGRVKPYALWLHCVPTPSYRLLRDVSITRLLVSRLWRVTVTLIRLIRKRLYGGSLLGRWDERLDSVLRLKDRVLGDHLIPAESTATGAGLCRSTGLTRSWGLVKG